MFLVLPILTVGCALDWRGSKSSGGDGSQKTVVTEYRISYEAKSSAWCSTGRQEFVSASEQEIINRLCSTLKDNSQNGYCGEEQRKNIFEASECEGEWPHEDNRSYSSVSLRNYAFRENKCGTGLHIFATTKSAETMKLYCKALLDDELNNNCARSARKEQYERSDCDIFI